MVVELIVDVVATVARQTNGAMSEYVGGSTGWLLRQHGVQYRDASKNKQCLIIPTVAAVLFDIAAIHFARVLFVSCIVGGRTTNYIMHMRNFGNKHLEHST